MSPELPRRVMLRVAPDVRLRYLRSERPPIEYAITLELRVDGVWRTVRLWDNADELESHHEHPYTEAEGKQAPMVHVHASTNEAMAAAIETAVTDWFAIVSEWRRQA